jgi:hypothetical protein
MIISLLFLKVLRVVRPERGEEPGGFFDIKSVRPERGECRKSSDLRQEKTIRSSTEPEEFFDFGGTFLKRGGAGVSTPTTKIY